MSGISAISSTYTPILLSHQTGLSSTVSTANTYYNIGSSISIPRNGIAKISIIAHIGGSSDTGYLNINLTRNSTQYNSNSNIIGSFTNNTPLILNNIDNGSYDINVLKGDILQFMVTSNLAGDTVYVDDLVVILQ